MMIKISRLLTHQLVLNHSQVIEIHLLLISQQDMARIKVFEQRSRDFILVSARGQEKERMCCDFLKFTLSFC